MRLRRTVTVPIWCFVLLWAAILASLAGHAWWLHLVRSEPRPNYKPPSWEQEER